MNFAVMSDVVIKRVHCTLASYLLPDAMTETGLRPRCRCPLFIFLRYIFDMLEMWAVMQLLLTNRFNKIESAMFDFALFPVALLQNLLYQ